MKDAAFSLFTTTTTSTAEKETEEVEERLNEQRGGEKGSIAVTQFYVKKSRKEGREEVMEEVRSWNCREKKRGRRGEVKTEKELQHFYTKCQSRGAERRNAASSHLHTGSQVRRRRWWRSYRGGAGPAGMWGRGQDRSESLQSCD